MAEILYLLHTEQEKQRKRKEKHSTNQKEWKFHLKTAKNIILIRELSLIFQM